MAIYAHIWTYINGHLWAYTWPYMCPYMNIYGQLWPYMGFHITICGHIGPCMDPDFSLHGSKLHEIRLKSKEQQRISKKAKPNKNKKIRLFLPKFTPVLFSFKKTHFQQTYFYFEKITVLNLHR